jgi:hypothetical protein
VNAMQRVSDVLAKKSMLRNALPARGHPTPDPANDGRRRISGHKIAPL